MDLQQSLEIYGSHSDQTVSGDMIVVQVELEETREYNRRVRLGLELEPSDLDYLNL
jgi:hypothetical protein